MFRGLKWTIDNEIKEIMRTIFEPVGNPNEEIIIFRRGRNYKKKPNSISGAQKYIS